MKLLKNPMVYGLIAIILLALWLPSLGYSEGFSSGGSSCELTPQQFAEKSKSSKLFTLFYAPWCGHCKKMKPDWESAASQVNKNDMKMVMVNLGDQDNKAQEQLRKKYELKGYPTIMDISNGKKISEYDGSRDTSALVNHAKSL